MTNTIYGVRKYTCSTKTRREEKIQVDENLSEEEKQKQIAEILKQREERNEKRNNTQKRLYITLENIDEMFSNNDKYPISYNFLFNLIQGKVTKYFNTTFYERKKELSYTCIVRLYSILKRKLLRLKDQQGLLNPKPVLFFLLSQFFRYIDLLVYSTVHYGTIDLKYEVQELEDLPLIQELFEGNDIYKIEEAIEKQDKRDRVKKCIDSSNLTPKEKALIHKIYRASTFMGGNLTNKDREELKLLQEKLQLQPGLLQDLEDVCND